MIRTLEKNIYALSVDNFFLKVLNQFCWVRQNSQSKFGWRKPYESRDSRILLRVARVKHSGLFPSQ
jgi:hypothetical protein